MAIFDYIQYFVTANLETVPMRSMPGDWILLLGLSEVGWALEKM